ncbi:MAG TPA: DegQ family serine endoprotease [Burkholderiales bacterium]|nr:DegQ family serine endoprotease [Burkholderiales bacterium]
MATTPVPVAPSAPAAAALPDFTSLVAANGPAVVNITVTQKAEKTAFEGMPQGMDPSDPFYQFFRRFGMPAPGNPAPAHGLGSGFIVSPDGLILTNAHVVADASEVTVKLTDKREFRAKVVGVDRPTDVAVIRIDAKDLPTVKLGDSNQVKVGEWVVAIGSPYGFENTVTSGIVSAKARTLPDETYVPFLQTDVAVNPGNSGGPLFNMRGEVVGINSQIYSRSGGYQGLSFAVPIDVAVQVKDQLLKHGTVTRGRLGVTIQDVNQALADSFGLKQPGGALVSAVEKDSPAAKAGIEPGDVITRYGDTAITGSSQLPVVVASTTPGKRVPIEVVRKGKTRTIDVAVGELKSAKVAAAAIDAATPGKLGVAVRPLAAAERQQLGVKSGLVVEQVSGPAARAGLQPGDVILSLNGTPVTTADQLKGLLAKAGKHVAVLVQREDMKTFVPIDLG